MSSLILACRRHRGLLLAAMTFLALLTAGPARAHSGWLTIQPGTTLDATFSVGSLANGSAPSTPFAALAYNIELYPAIGISFGFYGRDGLKISMTDVAFSNPSVGSFDLKQWEFEIVTPTASSPLAADGSFSMADQEVHINKGQLSGNLIGFGPVQRDFWLDPLTLTLGSPLTGHADGDTRGGTNHISLAVPFDHTGTLAAGNGLNIDVSLRGELLADGRVEIIPEPSTTALFVAGFVALGAWQRRRRLQGMV